MFFIIYVFVQFEIIQIICNGNGSEWSPIRLVIILVITKSDASPEIGDI